MSEISEILNFHFFSRPIWLDFIIEWEMNCLCHSSPVFGNCRNGVKIIQKWHLFNLIYRNWKFWLCYQIIWLENFNINGIEFNDSEICRCISDAFFSHLIWFNFLFLKNENMSIFLINLSKGYYKVWLCKLALR